MYEILAFTAGILIGIFSVGLIMNSYLQDGKKRLAWLHVRAVRQRRRRYVILGVVSLFVANLLGLTLILGVIPFVAAFAGIVACLTLSFAVSQTSILSYRGKPPTLKTEPKA